MRPCSCAQQGDDAGTTQTDIVLKRHARAIYLALPGAAAQMPDQLGDLRQPGGAQRMSLGQKTAGGIDHHLAAIGVVAVENELFRNADGRETERLVADDLIRREAI